MSTRDKAIYAVVSGSVLVVVIAAALGSPTPKHSGTAAPPSQPASTTATTATRSAPAASSHKSGAPSNGGTGLVTGTVDNHLASSMFDGMKESDARSALNGKPLESYPYATTHGMPLFSGRCEYYRGVTLHVGRLEIKATGTIWRICSRHEKVGKVEPVCPIPWKPGEFQRYKNAGYSADPTDCAT